MATKSSPQSLKNKKFTQLADLKDKLLSEDYVYDTFETYKIKGETLNNGKWDYKVKIKDFSKELSTELKVQFPWNRYWFWLGIQSGGAYNFKFHVDAGDFTFFGRRFNLFSNLKTQTNFKSFQLRLGANYWGDVCESNTRLEIYGNHGSNENALTQRTIVRRGSLFYGFVGTIGLQTLSFKLYDAILGYEQNNVNFYLQHKSQAGGKDGNHGFKLGKLVATTVVTRDNLDVGAEGWLQDNNFGLTLGAQSRLNSSTTLKGRISNDLDLTLAYKKKVNSLLTITTSALLGLKDPKSIFSNSSAIPVPLGFQFELNI